MMRYSFEQIKDRTAPAGVHYRIRDERDNRVATCYDPANAVLVVMSMNFAAGCSVDWVCGHTAAASCQQCWFELANKAHRMAEALIEHGIVERAAEPGEPGHIEGGGHA